MKRFVLVFALLLLAVAPLALQGQEMNEVNFGLSQNVDTLGREPVDLFRRREHHEPCLRSAGLAVSVGHLPPRFGDGMETSTRTRSEWTFQLRDDVTFHDGTPGDTRKR